MLTSDNLEPDEDQYDDSDFDQHCFVNDSTQSALLQLSCTASGTVCSMSGKFSSVQILTYFLSLRSASSLIWKQLKQLSFHHGAPRFKDLLYKWVLAGEEVYGHKHRHDGAECRYGNKNLIVLIEAILALIDKDLSSVRRLALLHSLKKIDAEEGKANVVQDFGHNHYAYFLSDQSISHTILIDCIDMIRLVMVVVDSIWVKRMHRISMRFCQIANDL